MPILRSAMIDGITKDNCPRTYNPTNNSYNESMGISFENIPWCNDTSFKETLGEEGEGCCLAPIDTNCKTYTGNDNHNIGLKFMDPTNADLSYAICHSNPVSKMYDSLVSDPNKIAQFFKLIFISIVTLLVTAIIGTCYEFWLRYGESKQCIYYKSKCQNAGESNEISLVDFIFPNNICNYPYQACKRSQSGGKKPIKGGTNNYGIISNYSEYKANGAKCITVNFGEGNNRKPFPYNIADFAEENITSKLFRMPFKAFSFFFLFPIIICRIVLNGIFKLLSEKYQKTIKVNPILSNIVFLLLSGLIFPLIGFLIQSPGLAGGPLLILMGIIFIATTITSILGMPISLLCTIFPSKFLTKHLDKCNLDTDYYNMFPPKLFYPLSGDINLGEKILNIIKNILFFVIVVIMFILSFFAIGLTSTILSTIYISFNIIFNMFYIPFSNPKEFFDILKSHGNLLTILFCISVILSSAKSLHPSTTGIMSGILSLIIIYKIINSLNKNI